MYLERFTLPDAEQEEELIMERICETRDCAGFVDNPYPCRLFPARGLRELYFQNMTILYGGNGSGKSTLLNLIAEKLMLNRIAPFNSGEMVKASAALSRIWARDEAFGRATSPCCSTYLMHSCAAETPVFSATAATVGSFTASPWAMGE